MLQRIFWPALILNLIFFFLLLGARDHFPLNLFVMGLFTLTDGITLGLVLISIDENLAIRVSWLTALVTMGAALFSWYSGIDFSFLGGALFFALLILLLVSIFRIFVEIKGFARKVIASCGILIFVGYLLFDFGRLKKLGSIDQANAWNVALDMSIDIYLDIINLFLQILDLLSD